MGSIMNPDKEQKLHAYVESQMGLPFKFGVNDCPLFTLGCMDVMHDTDRRKEFIGLWHDQKSAWKWAKKHGDIYDHLLKWGYKRVDIQFIQTGDIVIMEQNLAHAKKWRSVAVCLGSKVAIVTEDYGVIPVDLKEVPNIKGVVRWQ